MLVLNTIRNPSNQMERSLTIIIPAFNESNRILSTLNAIDEFILSTSGERLYKVIVINDGSVDNTKEKVNLWIEKECKNKNCFQLKSYMPNKGKGYAVREGFVKVTSDLALYTDADGASPIREIEKLLPWIDKDFDIVVGSRVLKGEATKVSMSFKRRFVGWVFHLILTFFNLASLQDTQCGFKLFKTSVAKKLAQNQHCFNYSFDIEYLFLAKKFNYAVKEVPINWYHVKGSKVNILTDSVKMLVEVLKIRFSYKYN